MDDAALEREELPERGNRLGRGLFFEARAETEVAGDDLEHYSTGCGAVVRPRGFCPRGRQN
jgi:hypothetical protein